MTTSIRSGAPVSRPLRRARAWAAAVAVGLAAAALAHCSPSPAPPCRPNVFLVVVDTLRGDRVSAAGYGRPTTPHLAEFATDATVFTNAWSPARWTPPAHGSLFTGLRPENHGCRPGRKTNLRPDVVTLAERLAGAGYSTGAFVANPALEVDPGLLRGFETARALFGRTEKERHRCDPADKVLGTALDWVREEHRAGRPFFAFVNLMDVHSPYAPAAEFERQFVAAGTPAAEVEAARQMGAAEAFRHNFGTAVVPPDRLALLSQLYDAEVAGVDAELGRLLDTLHDEQMLDGTLLIVVSDHGEYLGEHGLLDHMRGVHRVVLHVPLVLRLPGVFDGGRRVDDLVRLEDVAPTVAELCGLPRRAGLDGASLTSALGGRVSFGESLVEQHFVATAKRFVDPVVVDAGVRSSRSTTAGGLHLIENSDGEIELFDLVHDPDERTNLAESRPADVARLRALPR